MQKQSMLFSMILEFKFFIVTPFALFSRILLNCGDERTLNKKNEFKSLCGRIIKLPVPHKKPFSLSVTTAHLPISPLLPKTMSFFISLYPFNSSSLSSSIEKL